MANRPFNRFVNHLYEVTKNNRNLSVNISNTGGQVTLRYGPGTFVQFEPSGNRKGVELSYGGTNAADRRKGLGTRLRNYGIRAAKNAHVTLWQYGINLNMLVPRNQPPISTRIMRKLGAERTPGVPRYEGGKVRTSKKRWASIVRGGKYRYSLRSL